ncbi:hypothetical protein PybrP1_012101, partial [[Pythium] brassicae (nom. inval.)]
KRFQDEQLRVGVAAERAAPAVERSTSSTANKGAAAASTTRRRRSKLAVPTARTPSLRVIDLGLVGQLRASHATLAQLVQESRRVFAHSPTFPLSAEEVAALERHGNSAEDWSLVRKTTDGEPLDASRVRSCVFQGRVVLGRFGGTFRHVLAGGARFLPGCYRSTIRESVVLDDALVQDTMLLDTVLVDVRAAVAGCGVVLFEPSVSAGNAAATVFGNGTTLHVGVETGGRDLRVIADLPFALAAALTDSRDDAELQRAYDRFVDDYLAQIACGFTIVAPDARLVRCSRVANSFVGACALLDDADVANSTVLSSREEPSRIVTKSLVRNAVLQWRSVVEALSVVTDAFLCDCAHVERHGVVLSSVIGPNTSIAEGEVTASFVGPFVGFHHQALLIASYWPQGKGNVGYGANVGSNHTLKAPDQELFPGEGVFFGLGCSVKFPSNFVRAPYSVVATAVTTLPQRLAMPFSLINTPGHVIPSLSPAINEISPGWVLAHSVFTVLRNEDKFRTRNQSTRTAVEPAIFRPEIVAYMAAARAQLRAAAGSATIALAETGEAVYTDAQVPGLGKNYMRESARTDAVAAYTRFIQLYALDALLGRVESGEVSVESTVGSINRNASHDLATLAEEFSSDMSIRDCLRELVARRLAVAQSAAAGKARDDARGKRIIPDYHLVHKPVEDEKIVQQAHRAAADVKTRVARFLTRL